MQLLGQQAAMPDRYGKGWQVPPGSKGTASGKQLFSGYLGDLAGSPPWRK